MFSCFTCRFPGLEMNDAFHASAGNPIMLCNLGEAPLTSGKLSQGSQAGLLKELFFLQFTWKRLPYTKR